MQPAAQNVNHNRVEKPKLRSPSFLGSLGFVFSFLGILVPFVFSIIGLILSALSRKRRRAQKNLNGDEKSETYGYELIGIIVGCFGLILWTVIAWLTLHFRGLH
jgi:hypothetical protein